MSEDEALIAGCRKGERKSQQRLYDQYSARLFAICLRYARSDHEAEDVLQESFIKIFNKISDFRADSSLFYWMKRIIINTALNQQRSKLYMFPMHDVTKMDFEQSEKVSLAGYHLDELMKMVRALPAGCGVIFNLYAIEGFAHREIAEMLEISEGTSKSQYSRARSLLQEMLMKEDRMSYGTNK